MLSIIRSQFPEVVDYKDENIRQIITKDFFGRCYLCEEVTRHYEIDHFYPQKYYPQKVNDFDNLFYVCQKCNKIRPKDINTSSENEILDNTRDDAESLIMLRFHEEKNEIEITTNNNNSQIAQKVDNTIWLLKRIYNGFGTDSPSYKILQENIRVEIEKFRFLLET